MVNCPHICVQSRTELANYKADFPEMIFDQFAIIWYNVRILFQIKKIKLRIAQTQAHTH